jgi:hypothetical protein
MRPIVASFLVLSNFCALNAEPLAPIQKYRLACNTSQISAVQSCRSRCDDAVFDCHKRCVGQSCEQQCGSTHNVCLQACIRGSGC